MADKLTIDQRIKKLQDIKAKQEKKAAARKMIEDGRKQLKALSGK